MIRKNHVASLFYAWALLSVDVEILTKYATHNL